MAVDRFTGGSSAGAKFNAELSPAVTLAGEIHLEIGRYRLEEWGLGLMTLVLRDLLLADIPVGFGTAKGLNEYSAQDHCHGPLLASAARGPRGRA